MLANARHVLPKNRLKAYLFSKEGLRSLKELSKGRFFSLRTRAKHIALMGLPPSTAKTPSGHHLGCIATIRLDEVYRRALQWHNLKQVSRYNTVSHQATISTQVEVTYESRSVQTDPIEIGDLEDVSEETFPHSADFIPLDVSGKRLRRWARYYDTSSPKGGAQATVAPTVATTSKEVVPKEPAAKPAKTESNPGGYELYDVLARDKGFNALRTVGWGPKTCGVDCDSYVALETQKRSPIRKLPLHLELLEKTFRTFPEWDKAKSYVENIRLVLSSLKEDEYLDHCLKQYGRAISRVHPSASKEEGLLKPCGVSHTTI